MARGGPLDGKLELLDGPCGPPWNYFKFIDFHYYFHCFELLGSTWIFMSVLHKLYENHSFHYYSNAKWTSEFNHFLIFPSNSQLSKKQRKHEFFVFHQYFHCFELWDSTDAHVFPLKCSKKSVENAPVKTYGIKKTYLKPMKQQPLDLIQSM